MIRHGIWKWIILTVIPFVLIFIFSFFLSKKLPDDVKIPLVNLTQDEVFLTSPTIAEIFSKDNLWISALSAKKLTTIIFTGDIIPARSVNFRVIKNDDFNWPYLETYELTSSADLTVASLEAPLIKNCPLTNEGMIFCGNKENTKGLVYAGVDLVNVANNHFSNYKKEGIEETIGNLREDNIEVVGLGSAVVKAINNTRFGFLSYNDIEKNQIGIANADSEKIKKEILELKKSSDIIIVMFHWGDEYQDFPDKRQKELAYLAIDSGADLIIGNHLHSIQPVELYKDKIIAYAHGNFVFDQMWSLKTRQGVIGKYIFYKNKLIDIEFFPIQIENYGQPQFIQGEDKEKILNSLKEKSMMLSSPQ